MKKIFNYIRSRHNALYRAVLFLITIGIIVNFFPKQGKFKYEFQIGKQWLNEDLKAPFDFAILKSKQELDYEKSEILAKTKPYFTKDTLVLREKLKNFRSDFNKKWNILSKANKAQTELLGKKLLSSIYQKGVILKTEDLETKQFSFEINVMTSNQVQETELGSLLTVKQAHNFILDSLQRTTIAIDKTFLIDILENNITHNLFYNDLITKNEINEQIINISPNRDMMKQGMHIVSRGELIDKAKFQVLESLRKEFFTQYASKTNYLWITAGLLILVSICISLLLIFLYLFRRDMLEDNVRVTFMLFLITLNIIMLDMSVRFDLVSFYLLPFCILPIIMRIFFDTRTALFTHLMSCLIMGLIMPNPFEFLMLEFVGGVVAIFSIINLRNRSQLFITVLLIFCAYSATYFGMTIIQEGKLNTIEYKQFGWFGISALITLFSYPLIYVFEKIFGFVSEVTLLELADTNSKLLRELSVKAPGTFQHSLQVANLAEDAARQIGGNALLVRTGALYHDIGKMDSPMYFIENQITGFNPHSEISAEESAHIIIDHVIKGIEKAKKEKLPDQIIDFIRTHHGTLKVQYFYQQFLKNNPTEEIDLNRFQYPGPIPFNKETAVLMMADSVEAASRSLKKYEADTIDALVEKVINHQIEENQFAYSDITFKDITVIKKMFKKKLTNIYHLRIEYPSGTLKK